jgi:hypothetical protein
MARYQSVQTNFRVGQISPRLQGYVDLPDYQNALKTLENMVVLPQSSVTRRPGTKYVNTTYNNVKSRLVPFNFGQGESYVLEFSAGRIRIFYNNPSTSEPELIPDGGGDSSLGLTTYTDINNSSQSIPYLASELEEINWAQSADTMFLAHPNHPPLRLKRAGLNIDDWSIDEFPFKNGPFLPVNSQLTWLRPSNVGDADYVDSKIGEIPNSTNYILASTDALTLANHGLVNNEIVYLDNNVPSGSLVAGTNYYVVQATTNTFKLSTEIDGEPVSITGTGSGSDPIHVHQRSITEGATITLTALKGTKVEGCVFNQASASPANKFVTTAAHGLSDGNKLQFKTGNVDGFSVDVDYYVVNSTASTTEFQLAATSGGSPITVTGSDTVPVGGLYKLTESADHINDGAGFTSSDIGRLVRLDTAVKPKIKWGYGRITAVASTTEITLHVLEDLSGVNDTQSWALGSFSDTTGYPRTVAIYQQRMVFAGTSEEPQTVHFSKTGDFDNFSTTEPLGQLTGTAVGGTSIFGEQIYDDNALALSISSDTVDRIVYLSAQERLTVGTTGGIFQMFGSRDDVTLTPFNFAVVRISAWNAAVARPIEIGNSLLYIQQNGRKVRELNYSRQEDEYAADDLAIRAEDVTVTGVVEGVYQDQPNALVWFRRNDGKLACMTFVASVPLVAWHLHTIGGYQPDATYGNHAKVESLCVIPQTDHDQLWMTVKREVIGLGSAVASVTFNMTNGVFTKTGHTFSDGDEFVFQTVPSDMANYFTEEVIYYVVGSATNEFSLAATTGGTAINPNESGGNAAVTVSALRQTSYNTVRYVEVMQKFFDTAETDIEDAWFVDSGKKTSGTGLTEVTLDHLVGQTATFLGDGAPQPDKFTDYSDGLVPLTGTDVADTVIAGLGYESNVQTLALAIGTRENSSVGQRKRVHRIIVQFLESMGLKYGVDADNLFEEDFRLTSDLLDQAVPLFTGQKELVMPGSFTRSGEIYLRQNQALPFTVTLIALDYETND